MANLWLRPTIRGLAYLASANFIARIILFLDNLANSFFSYEMVLLYSAHLDTQILLFFQGVFMLPVALLGVLVFYGIEKQSFNLVLYPTLMLLFLILLRYGAEMALLIIHWEEHYLDRGPSLLYYGVLDLISIIILLFYVYMALAAPPLPNTITPSRLNSLRRKLHRLSTKGDGRFSINDLEAANGKAENAPIIVGVKKKDKKPPAPPPDGEEMEEVDLEDKPRTPPPRPPPSPKFNYKLRRNKAHLEKDEEKVLSQEELDKQKQRDSQVIQEDQEGEESAERDSPTPTFTLKLKSQSLKAYDEEPKRRSLLIETDLDASLSNDVKSVSPSPSPKVKEDAFENEKTGQEIEVDVNPEPEPEQTTVVEPEIHPVEDEIITPKVEDDEGSEWEYEYEVEGDDQTKPEDKSIPETETPEKTVDQGLQDDNVNVYEPETTTSSTGYKTTAV